VTASSSDSDPNDLVELVRATIEGIDAPREAPAAAVRARLIEAVDGPMRWAPFGGRVAKLWDLERRAADALLQRATNFDAWFPGPLPGIFLLPIEAGPRIVGAQAMFLRGDARTHFPNHQHLGEEHVLCLEGAFVNDDGSVVKRGDYDLRAASSSHAFDVTPDGPCVCAYLLYGGFVLG
jgi:anti-sigma factor ChrR (cupin superfamily)